MLRSIRRTEPVVTLLTQTPPAPTARRSGAWWGAIAVFTLRPPFALIAVTPPSTSSATQTRVAAEDEGARTPTDVDPLLHRAGVPVDSQDLAGARAGDPDRFGADGDAGNPSVEVQRRSLGSAACRVDPRQRPVAGARHPDRALAGRDPQRAAADGDRSRDRGLIPTEELLPDEAGGDHDQNHADRRQPAAGRGPDSLPNALAPALGRAGDDRVRRPSGASESTAVAAGVAPWRSRAASIRAPAVW